MNVESMVFEKATINKTITNRSASSVKDCKRVAQYLIAIIHLQTHRAFLRIIEQFGWKALLNFPSCHPVLPEYPVADWPDQI